MGEVYRARDSKLKRDVALKVLPATVASDPERLARFQREAEVLASLNHPHIAQIHGFEDADGTVKVLDFGLAKALDQGSGIRDQGSGIGDQGSGRAAGNTQANSPTITSPAMTMSGVILGTAAYMSPEQARGKFVDRRTDIWALGAVLFEMLAGGRPFDGETLTDVLGSIVKSNPDWKSLPADTPEAIQRLLRRTLEKNVAKRLDSAAAARLEIDDAIAGEREAVVAPPATRRAGLPVAIAAATGIALAVMGAASAWLLKPTLPAASSSAIRFSHAIPDSHVLGRMGRRSLTISPDGKSIAYIANQQLYLRRIDELEARPIPGSNLDPIALAFSPDSQSIAFSVPGSISGSTLGGSVRRIPITGGAATTICPSDSVWSLRWQADRVLFSSGTQIFSVADTGGTPDVLIPADPTRNVMQPQLLSDGRTLLYTAQPRGTGAQAVVVQAPGGPARVLVEDAFDGFVAPTGHLVWVRDNVLFAQAIDTGTWQLTGRPAQITAGVGATTFTWAAHAGVSDDGTLAFLADRGGDASEMIWVDRRGSITPVGAPTRNYRATRLSPDGSRIAATTAEGELWIWDLARRAMSRLESGLVGNGVVWSRDGRFLIYVWQPPGGAASALYRRAFDGTGTPERLFQGEPFDPLAALPDGRILGRASSTPGAPGLFKVWLPESRTLSPPLLPEAERLQMTADVSPDGRWIATHHFGVQGNVSVRPFPDLAAGYWPLADPTANRPMWSRSGRELFWVDGAPPYLWRAEVLSKGHEPFAHSTPEAVIPIVDFATNAIGQRSFDLSLDGERFLLRQLPPVEGATRRSITVVTNWFEELRDKVK